MVAGAYNLGVGGQTLRDSRGLLASWSSLIGELVTDEVKNQGAQLEE